MTTEFEPLTTGAAADTPCGCHPGAMGRLHRGARHLLARALGAPLWACAGLAALGLAAALLLALH